MAQKMDKDTDAASIKPVSSLRSHFEGLKVNQSQLEDRGSNSASPHVLRPVDASSPLPTIRASFDLPRPSSPWSEAAQTHYGGHRTPTKGTDSPPKPGHKRPVSMLLQSSPQLTPSVKVESPRSPPRTFFERSSSRSPERIDNTPFAKVRELISQHSSRASSRPPTSRAPSVDRSDPSMTVERSNIEDFGISETIKPSTVPPPINRADKPKIPAKPTTIPMPPNTGLNPEARQPSFDAKVSPFSTPPSSDENSPSRSPEPQTLVGMLKPSDPGVALVRAPIPLLPPPAVNQAVERYKEPRLLGFASKPVSADKRDPRTLGFAAPEPKPPSQPAILPSRANTVSEKPTRDPRELGLSTARPAPRHVSESIRHAPSSPMPTQPITRAVPSRDARMLGFSSHQAPEVTSIEEEPRPGLPPRRMEPPPRPSNESKNTVRTIPPPPSVGLPDRSKKPISSKPISRAPALPLDVKFPPPPKRGSGDDNDSPLSTITPRAHIFTGDIVKRSTMATRPDDSDDMENVMEEPSTIKSEYPDATNTNRRMPFPKSGVCEITTKSESRVAEVCGKHLCTTGYITRVFDMSSGEQVMSLNHGETVKVTAVVFKPGTDLASEGQRLWLGTNIGDIMEVDIDTHTVMATSSSHNRREIVRIIRSQRDIWTLDDEGKLFVWKADETEVPNLKYSHVSHKTQKGHTFSMAVDGRLWLATGKEIRAYQPGNESNFAPLTKPLSQHGTGDITCGTYSSEGGGRAYFGHNDGRVTMYSTKDFTCVGNVKASDYKINSLTFVGDALWAAFKTGKIYVYDTKTSPWKVKKDWRAHDGPATEVLLDPSSFWVLHQLQVVTIGHDNFVRLWDATLEDDWIESEMQTRDVEYCTFRELRAAVITWNVGASTPYDIRNDFIADAIHADDPPEIIAFGFQEVVDLEDRAITAKSILGFSKKKDVNRTEAHQSRVYREWRDYLMKMLSRYCTQYSYTELHTSSMIGLFQCVLIRQQERPNVRNLEAANVKLGLKGHYGNKGALVTRFVLDDSSICFINCHLAAGQTHTSHRNNDVASILEAEALTAQPDPDERSSLYIGGGDGTQILDHEICILNGDLNYRIDAIPRDTVISMVKRGELSKLLERDQIMVCRKRVSGFRLGPFVELPITFAPTYKYDVGTDNYDSSEKKRAPAWCDRLLYRGAGRVKQIEYRRHEVRTSDHRPVSGLFKIRVKTIDPKRRAKVKAECFERFGQVRRQVAEAISVTYLIRVLGIDEREARTLIMK
ncbi:uncharacterized protein A1O9_13024 [Exophiala aquamarina CBS 119918]|uniref:Inositol polyphosphate-related phosphatase domain-containing protein n=1 Tax=Exophiala aquamarina CBS 119918 TaxID=1182545 RepID=A0A072P5M4_9EURO|nr:uncharacterized protein A1O9_13024 [Exophiala aquamarina CBS 119918]KEF50915.1 hypothetical protein A1O9_13024 [Exophiala aquamarina CBS 119918]